MISRSLSTFVVLLTATTALAEPPPQKLDIAIVPAEVVDNVVIPIPQEIFASLDKLGKQDWTSQLTKKEIDLDTSRSRSALLFGLVISDGFVAVQAKNREEVKRIGRDVLKLATAVGVQNAVSGHAQAIIEHAENNAWSAVRQELDRTRQTVIDTMGANRDQEFADLVSIGGWLGGTRALSSLVAKNFSPDGSELLNQPELLDQIATVFTELPARIKRGKLFDEVGVTLENLKPLMRTNNAGLVPAQSVAMIAQITSSLTDNVYEK